MKNCCNGHANKTEKKNARMSHSHKTNRSGVGHPVITSTNHIRHRSFLFNYSENGFKVKTYRKTTERILFFLSYKLLAERTTHAYATETNTHICAKMDNYLNINNIVSKSNSKQTEAKRCVDK